MKWRVLEKRANGNKLVECIAEIKELETGKVVLYTTEETLKVGESFPNTFNWAENNFSCDCNRELFFRYGQGLPVDDLLEKEDSCNHEENKYLVNLRNPVSGELYYNEH